MLKVLFPRKCRCDVKPSLIIVLVCLSVGWVGVDVKPLQKERSDLAPGQSGTYYQLSDAERKELVWMAKAAKAAYPDGDKPLGYRSFTRAEWEACSKGCPELIYTEDGYFNVGSGLRGRLMVHMVNEGRVVLALSGVDMNKGLSEFVKDIVEAGKHYLDAERFRKLFSPEQYRQSLQLMNGVLTIKQRSHFWIVGHSLGGSLATYLALEIPSGRTRIKCATFNGLGFSPFKSVSPEQQHHAAIRVRNVYCDGDPIYDLRKLPHLLGLEFQLPLPELLEPRHFGPSYSIIGTGTALEQHSLDGLLRLMIKHRTKWQGL